jgi:hypothetical protein
MPQQFVNTISGLGIPGELFDDGPVRCEPYMLNSPESGGVLINPNVFGYAYTIFPGVQGQVQIGNPAGNGVFAGYLVTPKNHALRGVAGDTLAPTLQLPNDIEASFLNMGSIIVVLPTNAPTSPIEIGYRVIYDNFTGVLNAIDPTLALPTGKSDGHAVVDRFLPNTTSDTSNTVTLAVIRVTTVLNSL